MMQPGMATMIWRAEHLSGAERAAAERAAAGAVADAVRLVARASAATRRTLSAARPRGVRGVDAPEGSG